MLGLWDGRPRAVRLRVLGGVPERSQQRRCHQAGCSSTEPHRQVRIGFVTAPIRTRSDSDDSDSSDSDDSDDSDDSVPVVPKKRVKLVARKAGGPGASSRKRAALPAGRPKKRAKQGGIVASYSKKELKASRALSLKNFIKAKLLIGRTIDKRQFARSFVCNTTGKPIGTSPAEMNRAYKAWALTAKGKYVGTGMDGHLKDRCSKQCCANGHRLNVCPALKTHLANKLGRKMRQGQALEERRRLLLLQRRVPEEVGLEKKIQESLGPG